LKTRRLKAPRGLDAKCPRDPALAPALLVTVTVYCNLEEVKTTATKRRRKKEAIRNPVLWQKMQLQISPLRSRTMAVYLVALQ